jgi:uncharacterized protein (TIGR02172 family)
MYELMDAETISKHIARGPKRVDEFANIMAELALTIHSTEADEDYDFPEATDRIREYIDGGIAIEDNELTQKCRKLVDELPKVNTLVHGDFHTGNVFLYDGEPFLIDMDRISRGHPIVEISDLYYFYYVLGEDDPSVVEKFMGFSYQTAQRFFDSFLKRYLDTEDESILKQVAEKASLLCYVRMIRKLRKKGTPSEEERKRIDSCLEKIAVLTDRLDSLAF